VHKRKVAYVAHAIVPNIQRPAVVVREPHAVAILACDNPEAIVLDFVQPPVAGGQLVGLCGKARHDEPGR
jgi:hypothetical protein